MPSPLARLPSALVHSILTFALVTPTQRGLGDAKRELQTLATVSREWNEYARSVASELALRSLALADPLIRTRRDLLELRRRVVLRRAFLRELTVSYTNQHASDRGHVLALDQWRAVLSHAPRLEALDLKWMVRDDAARIAAVVRAATRHCALLRSLVLPSLRPQRSGFTRESAAHTQLLMDAVFDKPRGSSPGLRELRFPIPFTLLPELHERATAYVSRICDVCPHIQTLDGYVPLVDNNEQLTSGEQWHLDAVTWERFCRTCTQLTSFDWIVAPFATTFFEIFGRYAKPKMERLVFSTPMNWDWDQYHLELGVSRPRTGYGATARNAHTALAACPSLRDLEVAVYLPGDGGDEDDDDGFGWDVYGGLPDRRTRVPDEPMMNQEIFGDEFCEHVARHCKQLEKFTIWRVLEASTVAHTIMTFTDRAMRALATLPVLRWVELKSVNITGDGLFALVACFAPQSENTRLQREYVITVGDEKGTATGMAFFDAVELFLERLTECEPDQLPCARRNVALRLHNGRMNVDDREWAKAYLARVSHLAAAATTKHPRIRLRLLTRRYDPVEKTCDDIIEFGFYTESTTINAWWGWVDEPQDTQIDDFVVCRGNLYSGGRPQARNVADEEDDDDVDDDFDEDEYGDY